jgi:hypothetical protein
MQDLETKFRSLLKGEYTGLTLSFNDCALCYETVAKWAEHANYVDWISSKEKEKACNQNTVWTLQVYPNTPVGSYCIAASSLAALMEYIDRA